LHVDLRQWYLFSQFLQYASRFVYVSLRPDKWWGQESSEDQESLQQYEGSVRMTLCAFSSGTICRDRARTFLGHFLTFLHTNTRRPHCFSPKTRSHIMVKARNIFTSTDGRSTAR
jgi:hypothetical protein